MSEHDKHINYMATDIEKYWKGELSAAEMHAMEKSAQEDPFLADAMEGYAEKISKPGQLTERDINELKERLAGRVADGKVVPVHNFNWWKVAAVIFVLIGGTWLYTLLTNSRSKENIAVNDVRKKSTETTGTDTLQALPKTAVTDTINDVAFTERQQGTADKKIPRSLRPAEKKIDSGAVVSAGAAPVAIQGAPGTVANSKSASRRTAEKKEDPVRADESEPKNEKAGGIEAVANKTLAAKPATNRFNGTIVNQFNQPVVHATVQIPDLNIATQTDNKGNFSFKAPDSALSVSIESAGFETQNLKLQNSAVFSNQIILKPATSSSDKEVVAGYDSQKRKPAVTSKALTIDILAAEPTVNWDEYNRYLQKNKKVPGDAKDIHGDVMVTFVVDNKGALKNFSVAKSLQDQLDREAIRLIKEGPSWRLLRSKKAKVTVVVKF